MLKAEQRPSGAATLPNGRVPGHTWNGVWNERLGPRTTASIAASNDSVDLQGRQPESSSGRVDLRHRAGDAWDVFASLSGSSYEDALEAAVRQGVATVGTEFRAGIFDLAASYRSESSSLSPAGGHGGRVSIRSRMSNWHAGLYADAQQHAATLQLGGPNQPDMPRPLVDLGLAGASPEGAVRMLRDRHSLLSRHGVELGALRVDPLRVQGGLDVRWRDTGERRTEFGVLLALDDLNGTDEPRRALLGQVRVSWRMFGETDVAASYANWSLQADPNLSELSLFKVLVVLPARL